MIANLIILTLVLIGGSLGYNFFPDLMNVAPAIPVWIFHPIVGMILGAAVFYLISFQAIKPIERSIKKVENFFNEQSVSYLIFGSIGAILGLILAILISVPMRALNVIFISDVGPLIVAVILAYLFFQFATSRREEIRRLFTSRTQKTDENGVLERKEGDKFRRYKVLDTSTIIDGRILDVAKAGFLEGVLVISHHVLQELQYIADSSDSLKRVRGRRGLDILNALQKEENVTVQRDDSELPDSDDVDMKLVLLAK